MVGQPSIGARPSCSSSLECLAYGLCAIGEFVSPAFAVTSSPDKITFRFAAKTFAAEYPADRIGSTLRAVDASDELRELRTTRHILSHRTAPGRSHVVEGPTGWLGASLDPATTSAPRPWVGETLHKIHDAADGFTANYV